MSIRDILTANGAIGAGGSSEEAPGFNGMDAAFGWIQKLGNRGAWIASGVVDEHARLMASYRVARAMRKIRQAEEERTKIALYAATRLNEDSLHTSLLHIVSTPFISTTTSLSRSNLQPRHDAHTCLL